MDKTAPKMDKTAVSEIGKTAALKVDMTTASSDKGPPSEAMLGPSNDNGSPAQGRPWLFENSAPSTSVLQAPTQSYLVMRAESGALAGLSLIMPRRVPGQQPMHNRLCVDAMNAEAASVLFCMVVADLVVGDLKLSTDDRFEAWMLNGSGKKVKDEMKLLMTMFVESRPELAQMTGGCFDIPKEEIRKFVLNRGDRLREHLRHLAKMKMIPHIQKPKVAKVSSQLT